MIKVLSVVDPPLLRAGIAGLVNAEMRDEAAAEWIRLQDGAKSPGIGSAIE
jgi:hypothetical protein